MQKKNSVATAVIPNIVDTEKIHTMFCNSIFIPVALFDSSNIINNLIAKKNIMVIYVDTNFHYCDIYSNNDNKKKN